jgi:WD40 repeat protein
MQGEVTLSSIMNKSVLPCITVALFAFPLPSRADDPADAERLAQQLGSKSFREREAASKRLVALGYDALGSLRRAANDSPDAEVRHRAAALVHSIEALPEVATLRGHTRAVRWLAFSPNGQTLASGGDEPMVRLWDIQTSCQRNTFQADRTALRGLTFAGDGKTLLSVGWDGRVQQRDIGTNSNQVTFKLPCRSPSEPRREVAFTTDGSTLASCLWEDGLRLWDMTTGKERTCLESPNGDRVLCLAFAPDGKLLVCGAAFKPTMLWDIPKGKPAGVLQSHCTQVYAGAFSPNNRTVATAGWTGPGQDARGLIELWDVPTGQMKAQLHGHAKVVYALAFSHDGGLLASGSADETSKVWDVTTGRELATLRRHQGFVYGVRFSPDSKLLAIASQDGTINLWDTSKLLDRKARR